MVRELPLLTEPMEDLNSWETKETLTRKVVNGFDDVRGAAYANVKPLAAEELTALKCEVFHHLDRCCKCGGAGHISKTCRRKDMEPWLKNLDLLISTRSNPVAPARRARAAAEPCAAQRPAKKSRSVLAGSCERCGRDSHAAKSCYAKRDVDGNEISDSSESESSPQSPPPSSQESPSRSGSCFRCGRDSHWAKDCYAKRDVDGNEV